MSDFTPTEEQIAWAREQLKEFIEPNGDLENPATYISYDKSRDHLIIDTEFVDADFLVAVGIYMIWSQQNV